MFSSTISLFTCITSHYITFLSSGMRHLTSYQRLFSKLALFVTNPMHGYSRAGTVVNHIPASRTLHPPARGGGRVGQEGHHVV